MARTYLLILFFLIIYQIVNHWAILSAPYDVLFWENRFSRSQLIFGGKAEVKLSDYDIYAIAGYKYLHGDDPLKLDPVSPPLGKLIIGTGITVFRSAIIMNLIFGLMALVLLYILSRQLRLPSPLALLALILIFLDPVFNESLFSSNLDIFQLVFLCLSLVTFFRGPRWFFISALSIGFMMATKFYLTGLLWFWIVLAYLFLRGNYTIFTRFIYTLPFVALGFVLPYLPSLLHNPDFIGFLRFQRWLTSWWAGNARVPWGGIFPVIFSGEWHTWWDKRAILPVPEWTWLWPISTVAGLVSVVRRPNSLVWLWLAGYLLFMSVTSAFPRYLVLFLPFAVIQSLTLLRV